MRRALLGLGLAATLALAGFALRRRALSAVTQVCAADFRLTGAPFPCLAVDSLGIVLRPPWADLVFAPTRPVSGVEDPFLQTPEAPNYFAAAWRARAFLGPTDWADVALAVNPALTRSQDLLHIHIGCLHEELREKLAALAPRLPLGVWDKLPAVVPHIAFWGARARDLDSVAPFRDAAQALAGEVADRAKLTIVAAGVRVGGAAQFLLLASYAGAPHSWWPVGAENLVDTNCPARPAPR